MTQEEIKELPVEYKEIKSNLNNAIKKASKNLSEIKNVDTWVDSIKQGKLAVLRHEKDLDNVIDTLEKHNEWRRDENVPPKTKMISSKELGEAIDKAIEILKTLK
jgi:hypothetical protein